MTFEEEVQKADDQITSELRDSHRKFVVENYQKLFDLISDEAMKYFEETGEERLSLEPSYLEFRDDGHFHNPEKRTSFIFATRRHIDPLPLDYSNTVPHEFKGDYQKQMKYALHDFRKTVMEARNKALA